MFIPTVIVIEKALSAVCPSASVALSVNVYNVGEVELPPKSVVVIAPVELFNAQFACDAFVNTDVVSEYVIAESDVAATVATVPEKLPATVPKEPADVVHVGAVLAVIIALALLPALPSLFSTPVSYTHLTLPTIYSV